MIQKVFATCMLLTFMSAHAQLRPITAPPGEGAVFPGILVTVNRFGVSPAKIVLPQGSFVLFVENRLADHEETFTLTQKGNKVQLVQFATHSRAPRNYVALNPEPGDYIVKLGKHTNLSIEITITP